MPAHAAYVETVHEGLGAWWETSQRDSLVQRLPSHHRCVLSLIAERERLDCAKEEQRWELSIEDRKPETLMDCHHSLH